MANNKSAIKRNAQNQKRRLHNRIFRSRAKTMVKNARAAIANVSNSPDAAVEAMRMAQRDLDTAARRGTIHPRNAARRKSRLMKQLAAAVKAAKK